LNLKINSCRYNHTIKIKITKYIVIIITIYRIINNNK
jgi:hypothetical protein